MTLRFGRRVMVSGAIVAILAGCGGSQPPIGAQGAMQQSAALQTQAAQRDDSRSWMTPDAASQDLLYVSSHSWVSVYTYPGGKKVGKLKGFYLPSGQCVDSSSNVFITDFGKSRVYMYAHGGTKLLRTLYVPGANSCSIDSTTGSLAVASYGGVGVWIFSNAKGAPIKYRDPSFEFYYGCAYDNKGNLFVDGQSKQGTGYTVFAELPKGASAFNTVELDQYIGWPSAVQWDGKYVAVGDQLTPAIYQFSIRGRKGTKVGTTSLGGDLRGTLQFWIEGRTVITSTICDPSRCSRKVRRGSAVMLFNYPAGGNANKTIMSGLLGEPNGDSVSLAPRN